MPKLTTILKVLFASPLLIVIAVIVVVNVNISTSGSFVGDARIEVIRNELAWMKDEIGNGGDAEMQGWYPEGYVFLNSIYALTWVDLLRQDSAADYHDEGLLEIHDAWKRIDSSTGRSSFDPDLPLAYGAFYNGWNTYTLGSKLRIEAVRERVKTEEESFQLQCSQIADALENSSFPVSYRGAAWPADVVVCMAALALHDELYQPLYAGHLRRLVSALKNTVDTHGLIAHSVEPSSGKILEGARGSSQALMLLFLHRIDSVFGRSQYELFKKHFVDQTLGLAGIREYPIGKSGVGDIDSGPVILGFGGVSTIVGTKTARTYGDEALAMDLERTVNGLSFPVTFDKKTRHFFGLQPMADAFIAWSHVGGTRVSEAPMLIRFRLLSVLAVFLLAVFFWKVVEPRKADSSRSLTIGW